MVCFHFADWSLFAADPGTSPDEDGLPDLQLLRFERRHARAPLYESPTGGTGARRDLSGHGAAADSWA